MKDLTKILKVGDEVYCTLTGGYVKITDINSSLINGFPIQADSETSTLCLTKAGHLYYDYPDAEPVIYPSKENRDWNTWNPIRRGDLVLAWDNDSGGFKYPSIYWQKTYDKHIVLSSMSRYNLEMCKESYDHVERITPEMLKGFMNKVKDEQTDDT